MTSGVVVAPLRPTVALNAPAPVEVVVAVAVPPVMTTVAPAGPVPLTTMLEPIVQDELVITIGVVVATGVVLAKATIIEPVPEVTPFEQEMVIVTGEPAVGKKVVPGETVLPPVGLFKETPEITGDVIWQAVAPVEVHV